MLDGLIVSTLVSSYSPQVLTLTTSSQNLLSQLAALMVSVCVAPSLTYLNERLVITGGDQGLLNSFFSNWINQPANHLPFVYNCSISTVYSYLPAFKKWVWVLLRKCQMFTKFLVSRFEADIKIIHFLGSLKPWQVNFNFEYNCVADLPAQYQHLQGYFGLWWTIFTECVHPVLTEEMVSDKPFECGVFNLLSYDFPTNFSRAVVRPN